MSLKGLFSETDLPIDEQILRAISGNLCRCGAYRHVLLAGQLVAERGQYTLAETKTSSSCQLNVSKYYVEKAQRTRNGSA